MKAFIFFTACIFSAISMVGQTDDFIPVHINSGNPTFPFPQFLDYKEGTTLAKHNAEGVTHADMEKTMREAYEIMTHRCRYEGGTHCGVPYITFNSDNVEGNYGTFCTEGDGYILLAAAMFADQNTFNGLWMWMHDNRLSNVVKYKDCQELRPGQTSGPYMPGWEAEETTTENHSLTHSASDGDFDMAMGLLIAYKQWGEFMMQDGSKVIDDCGNPISYKEAAEKFIKALVDTIPNYTNNGLFAGYISGDIGVDGYVKSGNTWGELTDWRHNDGAATYDWAKDRPTLGSSPSAHYFDYNAPAYFNEFAYWLEHEDGNGTEWQINQFKRAEASSDFLIGEAYKQGNIAAIGKVQWSSDGNFTFGPFNAGEDFRASWRTILNYVWHGNPEYSWDPVTHQVVDGGNTFEHDMAIRHASHLKKPSLGGEEICERLGASPDAGQPYWWGVAHIPQAWGQTGETELSAAASNYTLGTGAPAAVASEDLELIADMYRQSELVWDDASATSSGMTEDERYIHSTPKYFHGIFRILGLLTNSGNLHAPRDMKSAANVKVYMSTDKTYAYQEDMLDYTVKYRNYGSAEATDVTITTPLDPDYSFVSASQGGKYNESTHSITWNIGSIPGFKSGGLDATIDSVNFRVKISDILNERVCLTSTISGSNFEDWISNEYPNNATYRMERNCVDILASRTLKVSKSSNRKDMNPNDIIKFTVDFKNESSDDSWLNGGRSNVYISYANYLPSITSDGDYANTSFYQFYRFWHDGAEAYINMNNYRVSYFMNDINKGFKSEDNPNGWIFAVDNQNDMDKYGYNPDSGPITFSYQKIPAGDDDNGYWNQRLMIRFADVLSAPATHVFDKLDSDYLLHKGVKGPGLIRAVLKTDPATNMKSKVADDWSYTALLQNATLDGQGSQFTPISPGWADYSNPGMAINNYGRHSCSPDIDNFDRVLVEEFDGYTWRRIQGRGPLPGKEAYNVTIIDTIPIHLSWKGFVDSIALDIAATYKPAPDGADYTGIVKWVIPEMLVGDSANLVYEAIAKDIGCPDADDVYFENAAWISSKTDSPDSSKIDLMITCAELPPIIDPQASLFKSANKKMATIGDIVSYELKFINTEGTEVIGDMSTQDGWIALGNGNIPLASGSFSGDPNNNTGISAPYFFANEKSYGVNGTLETTWDLKNASEFYFVLRYNSGTPYESDFDGICLKISPNPQGLGTIKFEVLDGTTIIATETSNVSYPSNNDGTYNPMNIKVKVQNEKIYIYINDFETVLKSYSGLLTTTPGYVGVYNGKSGNQQSMTSIKTSFDYAFDITVYDQLPAELGNIASLSDDGIWNETENLITWPTIPGPFAINDSVKYTYDAEVVSCEEYITNMGMATVFGLDTLMVLNSVKCGSSECTPPTAITLTATDDALCKGDSTDLQVEVTPTGTYDYEIFIEGVSNGEDFVASEAGKYTVVATDASDPSCSIESDVLEITEADAPAITFDIDAEYCPDATVVLSAEPAGGEFSGDMVADGELSTGGITAGETTWVYYELDKTASPNGCPAIDSAEVGLKDAPEITIDLETSYCAGQTVTLSADPAGGEFTGDAVSGGELAADDIPDGESVWVYYELDETTSPNGCPAKDSAETSATVLAELTADNVSASIPKKSFPELEATGAETGAEVVWIPVLADGTLDTDNEATGTPYDPGLTDEGIYTFALVQRSGECESEPVEVIYSVSACEAVTPVISTESEICEGEDLPLFTATGDNIYWFDDAAAVATGNEIETGPDYTPTVTDADVYKYYAASYDATNDCFSATAVATLTINPIPEPAIADLETSYCHNSGVQEITPSPSGGVLTINGTETDPAEFDPATLDETNTFIYTYEENTCKGSVEYKVSVSEVAQPETVTSQTWLLSEAKTNELTATGTDVKWIDADGNELSANPYTPGWDAEDTYTVYVTQTVDECTSDPLEVEVIVTDCGVLQPETEDVAICEDASLSEFELAATGTALKWYDADGGFLEETQIYSHTNMDPGTYTYYISQTDIDGSTGDACESPKAELIFTISETPVAELPADFPAYICESAGEYILGDYSTDAETAKWEDEDGYIAESAGAYSFVPRQENATVVLSYIESAPGGCADTAVTEVTAVYIPEPQVIESGKACPGVSDLLLEVANPSTGAEYTWAMPLSELTGASVSPKPSDYSSGTNDYTVTGTEPLSGCASVQGSGSFDVQDISSPEISIEKDIFCFEEKPVLVNGLPYGTMNLEYYRDEELKDLVVSGKVTDLVEYKVEENEPGKYVYYAVLSENCVSEPVAVAFELLDSVPVPKAESASFCQSWTARVPATAAGEVVWYDADGNTVPSADGLLQIEDLQSDLDYTAVHVNSEGCRSKPLPVRITMLPTPEKPEISSSTGGNAACFGEAAPLLTASGEPSAEFVWTDASGSKTGQTFQLSGTGTVNVSVTQTVNTCTGEPAEYSFEFYDEIPAPAPIEKQPCEGDMVDITFEDIPDGASPVWRANPTDSWEAVPAAVSASENEAYETAFMKSSGTKECFSTASSLDISITDAPSAPAAVEESYTACFGLPEVMEVLPVAGAEIEWRLSQTGNRELDGEFFQPSVAQLEAGQPVEFYAYAKNGDCYSPATRISQLMKEELPAPEGNGRTVCVSSGSTELFALAEEGEVVWESPSGETGTGYSYTALYDQTGIYIYTALAVDEDGCESPESEFVLVVEDDQDINLEPSSRMVCAGTAVQVSTAESLELGWAEPKLGSITDSSANSVTVLFDKPGLEIISATDLEHACHTVDTVHVYVSKQTDLDFSYQQINDDGTVEFQNRSVQEDLVYSGGKISPSVLYKWDFSDGGSPRYAEEESSLYFDKHFVDYGYGYYDVILTSDIEGFSGCAEELEKEVFVKLSTGLWVPNAIATGKDQPDPVRSFKVIGHNFAEYEITIYDNWGNIVWYSNLLEDGKPAESWDGTKDGKPLKSDTYIWRINAKFADGSEWKGVKDKNGEYSKMGNINLIK